MKKIQTERLLGEYDADPIAALTGALRIVLDLPCGSWAQLLAAAPIEPRRRQLLLAADKTSLDHLAAELNERRRLDDY